MTGIDPTSRLAALLSAQAATLRERAGKPATRAPGAAGDSSVRQMPREPQDAATLAAKRVQAIHPDDPQRARKAFRIFLESALLAELGPDLVNDPAFAGMVDNVHRHMEEDAELAPALAEAARMLLQRR